MECYHTVYTEGTGEIVEKKSRFIAEVFPVSNEEEAFAHLEEIRKKLLGICNRKKSGGRENER